MHRRHVVNLLPDPVFSRRCPKCPRTARFVSAEGEWAFYDCPVHRVVAVAVPASSTELSGAAAYHSPRQPVPAALHPGVEQESWQGFEGRMRAKRVRALATEAHGALEAGNLEFAERAWHEAYDLDPDAPRVTALAEDIARHRGRVRDRRTMRTAAAAVAVLGVAVALLLALESRKITPSDDGTVMLAEAVADTTRRTEYAPFARPVPAVTPLIVIPEPNGVRMGRGATGAGRRVSRAAPTVADARLTRDRSPGVAPSAAPATAGAIAPTTVSVPPRARALAEPDSGVPGASVAFLLSDAATRVAASSDAADAATSLTQVAAALRGYAEASDTSNIRAARQVWPTADTRVLRAAFAPGRSRQITLEACDINVHGSTADASCIGRATRDDRDATHAEAREWRFDLRRDGGIWHIAHAQTTPR